MSNKFCNVPTNCYIFGPTGPTGPTGEAESITIGNVSTTDYQDEAQVIDHKEGLVHTLDFVIPRGQIGIPGPRGKDGTSVTILGSYVSVSELNKVHPIGHMGESYLVGNNLYIWSETDDTWKDVGQIKGPQGERGIQGVQGIQGEIGPQGEKGEQGIPGPVGMQGEVGPKGDTGLGETISLGVVVTGAAGTFAKIVDHKDGLNHRLDFVIPRGVNGSDGEKGEQGPPGPLIIPTVSITTFRPEDSEEGIQVEANQKIPLDLTISNQNEDFILNEDENTITIRYPGTYRVDFVIYAYTINSGNFVKSKDIVSVGFRKVEETTVYAGGSIWNDNQLPSAVVGSGIITTVLENDTFELANVGKQTIYLNSPKLDDNASLFANPVVSMVIQRIQ